MTRTEGFHEVSGSPISYNGDTLILVNVTRPDAEKTWRILYSPHIGTSSWNTFRIFSVLVQHPFNFCRVKTFSTAHVVYLQATAASSFGLPAIATTAPPQEWFRTCCFFQPGHISRFHSLHLGKHWERRQTDSIGLVIFVCLMKYCFALVCEIYISSLYVPIQAFSRH